MEGVGGVFKGSGVDGNGYDSTLLLDTQIYLSTGIIKFGIIYKCRL